MKLNYNLFLAVFAEIDTPTPAQGLVPAHVRGIGKEKGNPPKSMLAAQVAVAADHTRLHQSVITITNTNPTGDENWPSIRTGGASGSESTIKWKVMIFQENE